MANIYQPAVFLIFYFVIAAFAIAFLRSKVQLKPEMVSVMFVTVPMFFVGALLVWSNPFGFNIMSPMGFDVEKINAMDPDTVTHAYLIAHVYGRAFMVAGLSLTVFLMVLKTLRGRRKTA